MICNVNSHVYIPPYQALYTYRMLCVKNCNRRCDRMFLNCPCTHPLVLCILIEELQKRLIAQKVTT